MAMATNNNNRSWNILNWNIRGINEEDKCKAVKEKIEESVAVVYCIQETKRTSFDPFFVKKFAPRRFNKFVYSPSRGASGGIIMGWNESIFTGQVVEINLFAITVHFTSNHNNDIWTLTTVYGPSHGPDRDSFIDWINNLNISPSENWIIVGDFNFYRSPEDRNRPGGNFQDMNTFNSIISNLGIIEIPLKGRNYTWSNMQDNPLLEQLDWCFTSLNWTMAFPNTLMLPLAHHTSDHVPCMVQIGTSIPKAKIFRFENFWVEHPGFFDVVQGAWNVEVRSSSSATMVAAKFKNLRRALKRWSKGLSNFKIKIQNCNRVLEVLDKLEENRRLYLHEANFRNILKNHVSRLIRYKNTYWKQRYTSRWVVLGDENTKFFHSAATERYRINTISSLQLPSGNLVVGHNEKAALLWEAFKERMGQSDNPELLFDLSALITGFQNLDSLMEPFTKEEIDDIVKSIPADRAPGPDGFNGFFLKKCWHIVKEDIYKLCFDFYNGIVDLQPINNSYITLVPKINNPSRVNDYRPISLLNIVLKILTKLLANRLQPFLLKMVHQNQYGFIRNRTIQDCLAWAYEYLAQCHKSKKEIVILKLDFEKAFDKIEHQTITAMLNSLGFPEKWIGWVQTVLRSGSSSILLNGMPGKTFHCKRGVRQGDPLSPLLFVLAAELLQFIVNRAATMGLLSNPLHPTSAHDFPVVQYADDTILIMKASQQELFYLNGILHSFSESTGLKVNHSKSCLIPINIHQEKAEQLAAVFGCQLGSMPFTYLGLPMGTTKPKVEDYAPLISKVERRLSATSYWLSTAGKLTLVDAVLTAMPTYAMCTLKLPATVIKAIDRARKDCLWRKNDGSGKPLIAWSKVTTPKKNGGLGVKNLRIQNQALLIKHLHKFYNKMDVPWVQLVWTAYYGNGAVPHATRLKGSFWWKDVMESIDHFRGIAAPWTGNGSTFLLWQYIWNGQMLQSKFPHLFTYATNTNITLATYLNNQDIQANFQLPLSQVAMEEFHSFNDYIHSQMQNLQGNDVWTYSWGNAIYSSQKLYKKAFTSITPPDPFRWIWRTKLSKKIKVFIWLLLRDRINSRNLLKRKHFIDENEEANCVMCHPAPEETTYHLVFQCPFSELCWDFLHIGWDHTLDFFQTMIKAQQDFGQPFFMEVFSIAAWEIWKQRNGYIFRNKIPSFQAWKTCFIDTIKWQLLRCKESERSVVLAWLDSI